MELTAKSVEDADESDTGVARARGVEVEIARRASDDGPATAVALRNDDVAEFMRDMMSSGWEWW